MSYKNILSTAIVSITLSSCGSTVMTGSDEPVNTVFGPPREAPLTSLLSARNRTANLDAAEEENDNSSSWYDERRKVADRNERQTHLDQVKRGKRSYDSYDKKYNE